MRLDYWIDKWIDYKSKEQQKKSNLDELMIFCEWYK